MTGARNGDRGGQRDIRQPDWLRLFRRLRLQRHTAAPESC